MIRPFLSVSTGTLASRLLGFVRDSLLAAKMWQAEVEHQFKT
jgi:putative peptidoglycan lipid II flippase